MKSNLYLSIAGLSGALCVGLGAFGAHAMHDFLVETNHLDTFKTASDYHMYHTLLLVFISLIITKDNRKLVRLTYALCGIGILVFSGSLYILCLTNTPWLGAITPIGGLLLISSWLLIGYYGLRALKN